METLSSNAYMQSLPVMTSGKKSFLIFKNHKYRMVPTDTIAFFYIRFHAVIIVCFDRQEYSVSYSMEQKAAGEAGYSCYKKLIVPRKKAASFLGWLAASTITLQEQPAASLFQPNK